PYNSQMVPGRPQKNWDSTGHGNGVQNRFVAVSIYNHNIVTGHICMPNNLIRCRGTVGHKKAMIGIKDTCRIALGLGYGPGVIEYLPQLLHCITHVCPQQVFSKKLVKHLDDGACEKGYSARMSRAMTRIGAI